MNARQAANGRRAHQMWSVEMWPGRTVFSRAGGAETSSSGKATSIRRRRRDTMRLPRGFIDDGTISWGRDRLALGTGSLDPGTAGGLQLVERLAGRRAERGAGVEIGDIGDVAAVLV